MSFSKILSGGLVLPGSRKSRKWKDLVSTPSSLLFYAILAKGRDPLHFRICVHVCICVYVRMYAHRIGFYYMCVSIFTYIHISYVVNFHSGIILTLKIL